MADIAIAYNPTARCCDLVFTGRDFALDATPVSALLISLGSDRRARLDDVLPDAYSAMNPAGPATLLGRRGWVGDGLDNQARLIGSRLWLLVRQKATEGVRKSAEQILAEALAWLNSGRGLALDITVRWFNKTTLAYRVRVGSSTVTLQQTVGGAFAIASATAAAFLAAQGCV
jgi:phage gp46-like protein